MDDTGNPVKFRKLKRRILKREKRINRPSRRRLIGSGTRYPLLNIYIYLRNNRWFRTKINGFGVLDAKKYAHSETIAQKTHPIKREQKKTHLNKNYCARVELNFPFNVSEDYEYKENIALIYPNGFKMYFGVVAGQHLSS